MDDKQIENPTVSMLENNEQTTTDNEVGVNSQQNTDNENVIEQRKYTPPSMTTNNISADPLLPTTNLTITNNQKPNQAHIMNIQKGLRSQSQRLNCPYCKKYINTEVKATQNIGNTIFCILSLSVPWCIVKCCQRKDFNCTDAEHKCPSCGNKLANYTAC
jgi:hypothetical protein